MSHVTSIGTWSDLRKQWIIGLHHGITEPKALERVRALPNSSLRVFAGSRSLNLASLFAGQLFHAKIILITSLRRSLGQPPHFVASSANLSDAALGASARNYEAGVALSGAEVSRLSSRLAAEWWARAWRDSLPVTDGLLDRYTKLRDRLVDRNPDMLMGMDPPSLPDLQDAEMLWIDAGAMSGGSRNQVEFNEELAAFFGPPRRTTRHLRIRANGNEWDDRPLAHKVTTFGVNIWRLSLPTLTAGGFNYPGTVIRFQKGSDSAGLYFSLSTADFGGSRARRWRALAHRQGYVGMTSGQRSFGFV